jgi:hypothetical protein
VKTRFVDDEISYDVAQLRAHWILRSFGLVGDALVAFVGPCSVRLDEMADLEDFSGPGIAGDRMLHFLWERFDEASLEAGVVRQRLFACIAAEALASRGVAVTRSGDDLYVDERKLSISIATRSSVSSLLHFAMNVSTEGTPVPTSGLDELGIGAADLAQDILARIAAEETSIQDARVKVRAKGEA